MAAGCTAYAASAAVAARRVIAVPRATSVSRGSSRRARASRAAAPAAASCLATEAPAFPCWRARQTRAPHTPCAAMRLQAPWRRRSSAPLAPAPAWTRAPAPCRQAARAAATAPAACRGGGCVPVTRAGAALTAHAPSLRRLRVAARMSCAMAAASVGWMVAACASWGGLGLAARSLPWILGSAARSASCSRSIHRLLLRYPRATPARPVLRHPRGGTWHRGAPAVPIVGPLAPCLAMWSAARLCRQEPPPLPL